MKHARPSDLALQVLSVLWDRGPSTVRQLLGAMPDGKKRAYTTMLSVVQVMEKKGLLTHRRDGLAHVYRPIVKKRSVLRPLMRELVRNVFGGRPSAVLQSILAEADVGDEELAEMRKIMKQGQGEPRSGTRRGGSQ